MRDPGLHRRTPLLVRDRERGGKRLRGLRYFLFYRVGRRRVAIDIDLPAGQPRGQPRVLAFLADRERELIFIYRNLDAFFLRIENEVLHFRGLERFEDELLRVGAPTDDVDLL